jgi:hypothetical protein
MSSVSISQSGAVSYTIVDLVGAATEGRVRIPDFQRPLRWQFEDVRRLFDSIVNGYPIGNLLLWKRRAPKARVILGSLQFEAKDFEEGWWVVDGQQRLTSLANALTIQGAQDERFSLAYDIKKKSITKYTKEEDGYVIPLPIIYDLTKLIKWFTKDFPEAIDALDEASRVSRVIRDYRVPAYLVENEDEGVLREIFDRMNNYGKRLKLAEVFSALHPGIKNLDSEFSGFQGIADSINSLRGFGVIDDDTVMKAVLARRGGNVSRDIRIEFGENSRLNRDFGDESPDITYSEGEGALLKAVEFLQDDCGIPHFTFLPYRYLLVVLVRFFAHYPEPQARNRLLLRRWFWRAAMVGPAPFSSSWTNAMRMLATRIVPGDETKTIQDLLKLPIDKKIHSPSVSGFRTNSAEGKIIISAMWAMNPCSLITGKVYSRQQLSEALSEATLADIVQRIHPRDFSGGRTDAANRLIILEPELPDTPAKMLIEPSLDLAENFEKISYSHILTDALDKLAKNDLDEFLKTRKSSLSRVVREFLERMAETGLEDTPPLNSMDFDGDDDESHS